MQLNFCGDSIGDLSLEKEVSIVRIRSMSQSPAPVTFSPTTEIPITSSPLTNAPFTFAPSFFKISCNPNKRPFANKWCYDESSKM